VPPTAAVPAHSMDAKTTAKLEKEMAHAAKVVDTFFSPKLLKDQSIPHELLVEAYGLVFLTVYKLGFLFSGKAGTGFIISRTTAGWSAPSFLASGGLGFGMMAGGEVVHYMVILNSRSAVKVFTRNGQVQLGSELDLAVGPIGRAASASVNVGAGGIAPNYSYSHSKGLYGGIGLSSGVICTRKSLNARCYGPNVTVRQLLSGDVPCPLALPLWQALDRSLGVRREYANGLPVLAPGVAGVGCDACGFLNATETHVCARCHNLLVYSIGVHSGRRNTSQLVASTSNEVRVA
jgi:lipid-binding SYLF domain-containing protein